MHLATYLMKISAIIVLFFEIMIERGVSSVEVFMIYAPDFIASFSSLLFIQ